MANSLVKEEILKPPRKAYLGEEFLRRLSRSIELVVDVLAQVEAITRQPEHTVSEIAADQTLTVDDYIILADATAGNITVTLPDAADVNSGKAYKVKKIDSSSNTVTVTGDANIDGSANVVLSSQYDDTSILTDQTEWFTI